MFQFICIQVSDLLQDYPLPYETSIGLSESIAKKSKFLAITEPVDDAHLFSCLDWRKLYVDVTETEIRASVIAVLAVPCQFNGLKKPLTQLVKTRELSSSTLSS